MKNKLRNNQLSCLKIITEETSPFLLTDQFKRLTYNRKIRTMKKNTKEKSTRGTL